MGPSLVPLGARCNRSYWRTCGIYFVDVFLFGAHAVFISATGFEQAMALVG